MSNVYPRFKESMLTTALMSSTVKVGLIRVAGGYDPSHDFLDDVATHVIASVMLTGKSVTDGVFDALDVTFVGLPAGDTFDAAVIYIDTGTPATSRLVHWVDGNTLSTNGGNVSIAWPNDATKIFKI